MIYMQAKGANIDAMYHRICIRIGSGGNSSLRKRRYSTIGRPHAGLGTVPVYTENRRPGVTLMYQHTQLSAGEMFMLDGAYRVGWL